MKRMIKNLCLAALLVLPAMAFAQPMTTRVSGHIEGLGNDSIYINMDDMNLDSPRTKGAYPTHDGWFDFTVSPEHVCSMAILDYELLKKGDAGDMKYLYFTIMPGEDAVISGTWDDYTVTGSQFYDDCNVTNAMMEKLYKQMNASNRDSILKVAHDEVINYIKAHPAQEAAMTLVRGLDYEGIKAALPLFDKSVSEGRMQWFYKPLLKMMERQAAREAAAAKIVEGQMAPAFTLPDLDGKPTSLADFQGRYLVLDFWGSWCSWCIKGFPDMRAAYDKYRDRMEILGIDCNDTEQKWKAAVEKHQAVWKHVRQSNETDNVSDMYGVQGFPTKIVIDPEGKIVKVVEGEDPEFYTFLDQLFGNVAAKGGNYAINGSLTGADGQTIYLRYGDNEGQQVDSTKVEGGKFAFQGTLDRPYYAAMLYMGSLQDYQNRHFVRFSLEPANITFTGDYEQFGKAVIQGGKTQTEENELNASTAAVDTKLEELNNAYNSAATTEEREAIREQMEPYSAERKKIIEQFYRTHPDSYISPYYLRFDMGKMDYQDIKQIYDSFTPDVKKYADVKDIEKELKSLANVQPGSTAPDFTANDINGQPFTLSSLRGKVVVIDFWASWCKPCRASNPHMLGLYKKYHDKGLEMVYVSDDDSNPDKWHDAVEKDGLKGDGFHHVLRGMKWDRSKGLAGIDHTNDISDKYAVHYLPTKYLIDRDGKIIGKVDDETLDAKLKEIFGF